MLCKTRFFFTQNTSVLRVLSQAQISRICIGPKRGFRFGNLMLPWSKKRRYSTTAIKIDTPKRLDIAKSLRNPEPTITNKSIGYWLISTSSLVFGIVVLGGLTRLTESGLSITEWKPVTGALPPLNQEDWTAEFDKYKNSPEFKQLNSYMTLEEFKFIYSMEWGHRLVGRAIGAFFVLPAIYFWASGKFSRHIKVRVVGLTGLLGLQGAIGWWMVKSGLDEKQLAERRSKPTVSQYRLTTHLAAAFLMYLGVLWTGFEVLNENNWLKLARTNPEKVRTIFEKLSSTSIRPIRHIAAALLGLTFLTAMSGGMVAGLDAGLIYNNFPNMTEEYPYFPAKHELISPLFSRKEDQSDLLWRNLLENPTTVQLVHRVMATVTFFSILAAHLYANKKKQTIPKSAQRALHGVMGLATLQVALGISTLIYLVPIPLAATHQAGALALLTGCLIFSSKLKSPRPNAARYINEIMKRQLLVKK